MKVRELQEQLRKLNSELDVVCYSEDERLLVEEGGFILLDVLAVSIVAAERLRLNDGTPYLLLNRGPASQTIATLQVTSDF